MKQYYVYRIQNQNNMFYNGYGFNGTTTPQTYNSEQLARHTFIQVASSFGQEKIKIVKIQVTEDEPIAITTDDDLKFQCSVAKAMSVYSRDYAAVGMMNKLNKEKKLKDFKYIATLKHEAYNYWSGNYKQTMELNQKNFKEVISGLRDIGVKRNKFRYTGPDTRTAAVLAFASRDNFLRFKLAFAEKIQTTIDLDEVLDK